MSPKKIDRPHSWEACLQDRAQPNVCVAGHLFMSEPSYWAIVTGHYLSTKWPFLRYSTSTCCTAFWCNPRWRVFLYFRCLIALIQGRRKEGKGRACFDLPSPPDLCACHAGSIPSQYFQWCIPWYIFQANSHVLYWLFWQLLKQSGWNFLVFPYYALPSKDFLWILSCRLASVLYIVFKKSLRESHLGFLHNHVFEVLFVCFCLVYIL